jgi:hypothetical protein
MSQFTMQHIYHNRRPGVLIGICCLALWCACAKAQNYAIDWYKVAGGGGNITGSVYSISSTIGQHDAGPTLAAGPYTITGGFWALYSVQGLSGPALKIFRTATNTAVVAWPSPSTGFNLQQTTNLGSGIWSSPPEVINDNGTSRYIIVNQPSNRRFFRLVTN